MRQALKRERKRAALLRREAIPREAHRIAMAQWDHFGVEREHPDWEYAAEVSDSGECDACHQEIVWGVTLRGKKAPFNTEKPYRVHLVTCPATG